MLRVKMFMGNHFDVEEEVNQWITEAERRGDKVIQVAASEVESGNTLWVLYEEQDRKVGST